MFSQSSLLINRYLFLQAGSAPKAPSGLDESRLPRPDFGSRRRAEEALAAITKLCEDGLGDEDVHCTSRTQRWPSVASRSS